jgi:hypothetical protein
LCEERVSPAERILCNGLFCSCFVKRLFLLKEIMLQILDPLPIVYAEPILCSYVNATNSLQVIRITNVMSWYFERVAFPGQQLLFKAPRHAVLEIHTGSIASSILSDQIPCSDLDATPTPESLNKVLQQHSQTLV